MIPNGEVGERGRDPEPTEGGGRVGVGRECGFPSEARKMREGETHPSREQRLTELSGRVGTFLYILITGVK